MGQGRHWKIAMIGGGGKISGATMMELLDRNGLGDGEIALYGRSHEKIERILRLAEIVSPIKERTVHVYEENRLEEALTGADVVLFGATSGLAKVGDLESMGVNHSSFILHVAEKMSVHCPDAWLLVLTNPPDIPLSAAYLKYGLDKVVGLCNASVFPRKVISAFLGLPEQELSLYEIGVNHELWYYDIRHRGASIYDDLKQALLDRYSPEQADSAFLNKYPEWPVGFVNTVDILRATCYLSAPVGGSRRFSDLPVKQEEIGRLMKRPRNSDYEECLRTATSKEDVFAVTRRCAAEFPIYIADVIQSILLDENKEHSIQVLNQGTLTGYPDHAMLHMTCSIGRSSLGKPSLQEVPAFIRSILSTRIWQNALLSEALANQDTALLRQSMLSLPERVNFQKAEETIREKKSVEPMIQLN